MLDDICYMQENATGKRDAESHNLFLFRLIFIYLPAPHLSCGTWDL